jgi:hypothetical protein
MLPETAGLDMWRFFLPATLWHFTLEIVAYGGQSPPATISRALLRFASQGQSILSYR